MSKRRKKYKMIAGIGFRGNYGMSANDYPDASNRAHPGHQTDTGRIENGQSETREWGNYLISIRLWFGIFIGRFGI